MDSRLRGNDERKVFHAHDTRVDNMRSIVAITVFIVIAVSAAAGAQTRNDAGAFPTRPVRLIIPFTPGAINDFIGRTVGTKLTELWGQQVVVDNRAGGNTITGTDIAAKSPPDGHTMVGLSIIHTINPSVHAKIPYDLLRDLTSISVMAASPFVLILHPSVPAKSLKELVALAKAKPGALAYGSSGTGGAQHLMGEMLATMASVQLLHVPYKGGSPLMTDLMGSQLQFSFMSYSTAGQHIKAGRLRALAVTSAKRSASTPDLPAIAEDYPGYDAMPWWSLAVPAATPKALVTRIHRDVVRVLQMPDIRERFTAQGMEIIANTPEQAHAHLREDIARWAKVVKAANIRAD